jgi:hypothetical protein
MPRLPRRTVLASLVATAVLAAGSITQSRAQVSTPEAPARGAVLPRDFILPLAAVQEVVPEMATETATGENAGALGHPGATRSVTYATEDGERRLVLSVDQHPSAAEAVAAFQEAVAKSREVPGGVTGETVSDLGEEAFIGVVTQGDETHVGGAARYGVLIVNATLQGYDGTDTNKATVTELIRRQAEHAEQVLARTASPTAAG